MVASNTRLWPARRIQTNLDGDRLELSDVYLLTPAERADLHETLQGVSVPLAQVGPGGDYTHAIPASPSSQLQHALPWGWNSFWGLILGSIIGLTIIGLTIVITRAIASWWYGIGR